MVGVRRVPRYRISVNIWEVEVTQENNVLIEGQPGIQIFEGTRMLVHIQMWRNTDET